MVSVLHTWTRALSYHPHVHYVVPGGGLDIDGTAWRAARGSSCCRYERSQCSFAPSSVMVCKVGVVRADSIRSLDEGLGGSLPARW